MGCVVPPLHANVLPSTSVVDLFLKGRTQEIVLDEPPLPALYESSTRSPRPDRVVDPLGVVDPPR